MIPHGWEKEKSNPAKDFYVTNRVNLEFNKPSNHNTYSMCSVTISYLRFQSLILINYKQAHPSKQTYCNQLYPGLSFHCNKTTSQYRIGDDSESDVLHRNYTKPAPGATRIHSFPLSTSIQHLLRKWSNSEVQYIIGTPRSRHGLSSRTLAVERTRALGLLLREPGERCDSLVAWSMYNVHIYMGAGRSLLLSRSQFDFSSSSTFSFFILQKTFIIKSFSLFLSNRHHANSSSLYSLRCCPCGCPASWSCYLPLAITKSRRSCRRCITHNKPPCGGDGDI